MEVAWWGGGSGCKSPLHMEPHISRIKEMAEVYLEPQNRSKFTWRAFHRSLCAYYNELGENFPSRHAQNVTDYIRRQDTQLGDRLDALSGRKTL